MNETPQLRIRSPKPGLYAGVRAAVAGLGLSVRRGPVRSLYAKLVGVVTLVTLLFQAAGIWAVIELWSPAAEQSWLGNIGAVIADIVGILLVLISAPLLAVLLVSIALPVLAESVFLAALESKRPDLADELRGGKGLGIARTVESTLRRILRLALGTALSFAVSLIPVAGVIIGPLTALWVTSRALTWELLDPWFDLQRINFDQQRDFIKKHNRLCLGFGGPYSLLLAVPIIGPMTFGIAQSGAGLLVADALAEPQTAK